MIDYTTLTPTVVESMANIAGEEGLYTVAWVLRELQADRERLARERDEARALVTPALEEGMEAVRQKQAAEAKFVELAKLHHAKTGENLRGPYLICNYDKTEWPCRTWELLFGEQT